MMSIQEVAQIVTGFGTLLIALLSLVVVIVVALTQKK